MVDGLSSGHDVSADEYDSRTRSCKTRQALSERSWKEKERHLPTESAEQCKLQPGHARETCPIQEQTPCSDRRAGLGENVTLRFIDQICRAENVFCCNKNGQQRDETKGKIAVALHRKPQRHQKRSNTSRPPPPPGASDRWGQ